MAVTKTNGFAAPYRSQTFQKQASDQTNRNGVLYMSGEVSESGGNVLIPPFAVIQQGLIIKKTTQTSVVKPLSLPAPFYVTVSAPTSANVDDLVYQFAKSPNDVSENETILAEYDGYEWRQLPFLSIDSLILERQQDKIDFNQVGPVTGLITSLSSPNYLNSPGIIVDKQGLKTRIDTQLVTPVIDADPDWGRIDRMVYRRPNDSVNRIGVRKLLLGSTFDITATNKLYDTMIAGTSAVHRTPKVLVADDNSVHFFYAEGYGESYVIRYQKYASDRTTVLVAVQTVATSESSQFDVAIDSTGNLHLVYVSALDILWVKLDSTGSTISGPITIDSQATPCGNPKVAVDPGNNKVFILYESLLGVGNHQIFFTTRTLSGALITSPAQITNTLSDLVNPSIFVNDDLLVYVAYEEQPTGKIFYQIRDDIGVSVVAETHISGATSSTSFGVLADQGTKPTIAVADNKQIFVLFLQKKTVTDYGLAIYTNGEAFLPDVLNSGEAFVDYSVVVDTILNELHLSLAQSSQLDYAKVENLVTAFSVSINVIGSSSTALAKDIYGSIVHLWTLSEPGTFTNAGTPETVTNIGPAAVAGSMNPLVLNGSQFSLLSAGISYVPVVGDQVTIAGSSSGNDGNYIVEDISLESIDALNDTYIITVSPTFAATESPAAGVTSQAANPDGNAVRFIKTVGELDQARGLRLDELDTDILLARIIMPGSFILNYLPPSGFGANSDLFGVYGDVDVDWEDTAAGELTISNSFGVVDLTNNFDYVINGGSFPMVEDDALYIVMDGTTPQNPVVTPISALPGALPIQVLGFVKNGEFNPQLFSVAGMGQLDSGEAVTVGQDLPKKIRVRLGITGENSFEAYSSTEIIATADSYATALSKLDAFTSTLSDLINQDRTLHLVRGGTWHWSVVGGIGTVDWSLDAFVQIPSLPEVRNQIDAGSINLDADGWVAYVALNRVAGVPASLSVSSDLISNVSLTDDVFIFARRVGNDVLIGESFLLKDDEYLELDGALAEINRYFGQLRIKRHETLLDSIRISGADVSMLEGSTLSQELNSKFVDDLGTVIDFTTGDVFEADGSTPKNNSFTPFSVPVGEYFWYGIAFLEGTTGAQNSVALDVLVTPAASSDASPSNAVFPDLTGDKKAGAILVFNNGGNIEVAAIRRLGTGSGSGGSSVPPLFTQEVPTGTVDGINDTFSLSLTPKTTDSLLVLVDSIMIPETEWSLLGTTLTFNAGSIPQVGQSVDVFYIADSTNSVVGMQETPSGTVDGVNDTFLLSANPPYKAAVLVFVDGLLLSGNEWSLVQSFSSSSIVFDSGSIPQVAQSVYVMYFTLDGIGGGGGGGETSKVEYRTISVGEAAAKSITLADTPISATKVLLDVKGVGPQFYGDDFTVSGNILSWSGLDLDLLPVVSGDKFRILYFT